MVDILTVEVQFNIKIYIYYLTNLEMNYSILMAGVSVLALLAAFIFTSLIKKKPEGTDEMKDIAASIHEGAMAF